MNTSIHPIQRLGALLLATLMAMPGFASSHMDAPLITLDPAANTTDVYAFIQEINGEKMLVTALGVYPHEEPGVGPNKYNFDDNVLYEIHVATGEDLTEGRPTVSYQFRFKTDYKTQATILQSYLGVVEDVGDDAQNLTQTYTVTQVNHRAAKGVKRRVTLGKGTVPPNNQGIATPFYNQDNNGENPAKDGVSSVEDLDRYTRQSIVSLEKGYIAFAGQRDDGFYGDIQAVFDLLQLRSPAEDAQGGFNIHLMALAIPLGEIGGDQQIAGVYGTTSRARITVRRDVKDIDLSSPHVVNLIRKFPPEIHISGFSQVGRQGNPLFNEGLVAIEDKDLYSRTRPSADRALFSQYAENPELAALINLILFGGSGPAIETGRSDIAGIYIPDLIKVDLSTGPCRLAGSGPNHPTNPDDPGFSRLGIFGGDVLTSAIQDGFGGGAVPGGWPNGRRFGDDVVDIAVTALISDLRVLPPVINGPAGDNLDANDQGYNKVFPYEGTPQNGRRHDHH